MKVCAISDMHGELPEIPSDADCLLIAGDICPKGPVWHQMAWLTHSLKPWLGKLPMPVFACAGNHDWPFFDHADSIPELPWTYLEDRAVEFKGFKIYGTPWQRVFYDWAFNLTEAQLAGKWNDIPDDTDILICHSPPQYYGDLVHKGTHEGSGSLLIRIREVQPKLVVFGHIHLGRGEWDYNGTKLANVTILDDSYKMVYEPYEVEL